VRPQAWLLLYQVHPPCRHCLARLHLLASPIGNNVNLAIGNRVRNMQTFLTQLPSRGLGKLANTRSRSAISGEVGTALDRARDAGKNERALLLRSLTQQPFAMIRPESLRG
jgi:hypothetical protein